MGSPCRESRAGQEEGGGGEGRADEGDDEPRREVRGPEDREQRGVDVLDERAVDDGAVLERTGAHEVLGEVRDPSLVEVGRARTQRDQSEEESGDDGEDDTTGGVVRVAEEGYAVEDRERVEVVAVVGSGGHLVPVGGRRG